MNQYQQILASNNPHKKSRAESRDEVDLNINVPDVFMKTKYGSIAQYNYDIKDQQNHPTPSKPTDKRQTPASIVFDF